MNFKEAKKRESNYRNVFPEIENAFFDFLREERARMSRKEFGNVTGLNYAAINQILDGRIKASWSAIVRAAENLEEHKKLLHNPAKKI